MSFLPSFSFASFHRFRLPRSRFRSLQAQEIFNIPLPQGMVLQSSRREQGDFTEKYAKDPLDDVTKGILDSSELLQRSAREYLTEKVNEREWVHF